MALRLGNVCIFQYLSVVVMKVKQYVGDIHVLKSEPFQISLFFYLLCINCGVWELDTGISPNRHATTVC